MGINFESRVTNKENVKYPGYEFIDENPLFIIGISEPNKKNSVIATSLFETKAMIGSGLLNVPYTFKTLGILAGIGASILFNMVTFQSTYFLLRCKDITQRYGYAVYSVLSMGIVGTIICKLAILIRSISLCCVLLKILGNIIRTILLIFFNEYGDKYYLDSKFLLVIFALLITPLMIQKDISGISKYTSVGIFSIIYLFASLVILFIYKYTQHEILPKKQMMLFPRGTSFEMFKCFGSYLNAFLFQVNVFPMYLPLYPRSTKNMMISTAVGTILSNVIYISFGIIGFAIYRYNIDGTLLAYIEEDLLNYIKTNKYMAALLIIFEVAFIINTTISTAINFFNAKQQCESIAKLIFEIIHKRNEDEGTPLVQLDETGVTTEIPERNDFENNGLSDRSLNVIAFVVYIITIFIGYYSDNIITIDNFNGSTINNFLSVMLPPLFFLLLSPKGKLYCEKFIAIFLILFSFCLITGYFLFNFTSVFG